MLMCTGLNAQRYKWMGWKSMNAPILRTLTVLIILLQTGFYAAFGRWTLVLTSSFAPIGDGIRRSGSGYMMYEGLKANAAKSIPKQQSLKKG